MARKPAGLAEASIRPAPVPDVAALPKVDSKNSRVGKKMVAGWFDRAAVIQLQRLAVDQETTTQDLLGRALDLLFREEGLPPLAQSGRRRPDSA
jgi:hypothetical protein